MRLSLQRHINSNTTLKHLDVGTSSVATLNIQQVNENVLLASQNSLPRSIDVKNYFTRTEQNLFIHPCVGSHMIAAVV